MFNDFFLEIVWVEFGLDLLEQELDQFRSLEKVITNSKTCDYASLFPFSRNCLDHGMSIFNVHFEFSFIENENFLAKS